MLDFWQAHKDWVQYDNGSFEPVDKTGDINKKPRRENEADWWVTRKEPAWKPPKFANTKRGKQAEKDYRLTTTMEKKPETSSLFTFPSTDEEQSTPTLSEPKKPATPSAKTALFTQPQHQNTGHASVRLSGPEDGKITMMQGGLSPDKTPQPNSARDVTEMKEEKAKQNRIDSARATRELHTAEKGQNRHDTAKDAHALHEAEKKKAEEMQGLSFAGYLDDQPIYFGRTEGVLYYEDGIPATEDGLEAPLLDPVDMVALGGLAAKGYATGAELALTLGKRKLRLALFGNRTGNKLGERPHYHRNVPNPKKPGESIKGQGIKRHRPWENKKGDQSWTERF